MKVEKMIGSHLIQNAVCKDIDSSSFCIHDDTNQIFWFGRKIEIDGKFFMIEMTFVFCPYCGQSYKETKSN